MENSAETNPLALDLFRTREKFYESEADFERVHAEYLKLESIARKQLKIRLSTLPSDQSNEKSETKSVSSICSKNKVQRTSSISSKQSDSSCRRYSSIPTSESTKSISKPSDSKESPEQMINSQLIKRITQFHENVESLESLYEKPVSEKSRFLKHLQRLNSAAWKTQKSKNPALQKLEKYFK